MVERCVPAHMMVLMMQECSKIGLEMRADVQHHLNVASVAPLAECDTLSVARLARRVDEVATTLLKDLSPDDPREGLYACAMFCLVLVEEGRIADVKNQAVLVSLMLLDDLKDESKDVNGEGVVWHLRERKLKEDARRLLSRATLQGLYQQLEMALA